MRAWVKDDTVEVMDWPPYSPDLNLIESLWFLFKNAIYKRRPDLLTMKGKNQIPEVLLETAPLAWNDIKNEVMTILALMMPRWVKVVWEAEG
jgi:hypothetical protein